MFVQRVRRLMMMVYGIVQYVNLMYVHNVQNDIKIILICLMSIMYILIFHNNI